MTTPDEAAAVEHGEQAAVQTAEQPPTIDVNLIRELAVVTDQLKAHEGAVTDLKARKRQLSEEILEIFELHGLEDMRVDGRKAYIHRPTFPQYQDKPVAEGGGKYTAADAVEALKAIGRAAQVQPETVNYQTMGAILREFRDAEQPVPDALAKVVKLGEGAEIRVGGARK